MKKADEYESNVKSLNAINHVIEGVRSKRAFLWFWQSEKQKESFNFKPNLEICGWKITSKYDIRLKSNI